MPKPATATDPNTGEELTMTQFAKRYGLHKETVYYRYKKGPRGEALIAPAIGPLMSDAQRQREEQKARTAYIQQAKGSALARPLTQLGGDRHA